MSADPRPLLRALITTDRRGAVWCAAQCARTVLHLVPGGDRRPLRAVLVAEAWAAAATDDAAWAADATDDAAAAIENAAAWAATDDAATAAASAAAAAWAATSYAAASTAAWAATSYAATAAAAAADAAYAAAAATDDAAWAADTVAYAADAAVRAAAYAAGARDSAAWQAARDRHLALQHALVLGETGAVSPRLVDVQRARPGAQVAWDWLQDVAPESGRVGQLSDALCRARRWQLRWSCPVERAIAERCGDAGAWRLVWAP